MIDELKEKLRSHPLRIGVSTRALFDLEEEHRVFELEGVHAYAQMQRDREDEIVRKGAGFEVIERLLNLNEPGLKPYVQVVLLSKNFARPFFASVSLDRTLWAFGKHRKFHQRSFVGAIHSCLGNRPIFFRTIMPTFKLL